MSKKSRLSKLNKILEKYQPAIQTISILLVLITVVIAIYQNHLSSKELKLTIQNHLSESQPKFELQLKYNDENRLNDFFRVVNRNPKHILQRAKVYTIDGTELISFDIYNKNLKLRKLKNILLNISNDLYNQNDNILEMKFNSNTKTETLSYPIIIDFEYIEDNLLKNIKLLYEYNFQIYFLMNSREIKSLDFIFIDSIGNKKDLKEYLLKYITESKVMDGETYPRNLKLKLLKKDSLQSDILNLISLNLRFARKEVILTINDTLNLNAYYRIPEYLENKNLSQKRDSIEEKIVSNRKRYHPLIIKKINQIHDSLKIFHAFSIQDINNLKYDNQKVKLFENNEETWRLMNQELLDITIDKFKVN